jgi:retron-type reverse transcriptase
MVRDGARQRDRLAFPFFSRRMQSLLRLHSRPKVQIRIGDGLRENAAPGADELTWKDYETNREDNLEDLHDRVQRGAYRPLPSRRVYIPKPDGRQRRELSGVKRPSIGMPREARF